MALTDVDTSSMPEITRSELEIDGDHQMNPDDIIHIHPGYVVRSQRCTGYDRCEGFFQRRPCPIDVPNVFGCRCWKKFSLRQFLTLL